MSQINIGNYEHYCSCVRYVSHFGRMLAIWLSLGLLFLLIVIVAIMVISIVRRRRRNGPQSPDDNVGAGVIRPPPDEYPVETGKENIQDSSYSRQLPDEDIGPTSSTGADEHYQRQLPDRYT